RVNLKHVFKFIRVVPRVFSSLLGCRGLFCLFLLFSKIGTAPWVRPTAILLRKYTSLTWSLTTVQYFLFFTYYDVCLKRRNVDSSGNSTCLKPPQSGFLEEVEAVPAESNGPQRKTTSSYYCSCYQKRELKSNEILKKRLFLRRK